MNDELPRIFDRFRADLLDAVDRANARQQNVRRIRFTLTAFAICTAIAAFAFLVTRPADDASTIHNEGPGPTVTTTNQSGTGGSATSLPSPTTTPQSDRNAERVDSYVLEGSKGTKLSVTRSIVSDPAGERWAVDFQFDDGYGWGTSYRPECGLPHAAVPVVGRGAFALVSPDAASTAKLVDSDGSEQSTETWTHGDLPFVLIGTPPTVDPSGIRLVLPGGGSPETTPSC
jgi:hypothetical protein